MFIKTLRTVRSSETSTSDHPSGVHTRPSVAPKAKLPQAHADAFETAWSCQSSPCTYGTISTTPESLVLFYGKESAKYVFSSCSALFLH